MNAIEELKQLAAELTAIAEWQQDQAAGQTRSGQRLLLAAKWLNKLSRHTCSQGYVGCSGGNNCTSDHK